MQTGNERDLPRTATRSRRRSSVVEWINGLTDNNRERRDNWGKVDSHERRTRNGSVASVDEPELDDQDKHKNQLIQNVKKDVKLIMSEAASRKALNIDSSYVMQLCASVDICLLDGLRRRLFGLFGNNSSLALLHSAAKNCAQAERILNKMKEAPSSQNSAHLTWIREALHERILYDIVVFIGNSKQMKLLYDHSALMMDRAKSGMLAALLLGPCAVQYKRMTTGSSDVTAEDLVERGGQRTPAVSTSRHPLTVQRQSSSLVSNERGSTSRDYVYSLHHNFKSSLIYGKNGVCLAGGVDDTIRGYLSLHKHYEGGISLRWTPNQLMHASSQPSSATIKENEAQWLWKQALNIDINDIIYLHLHQKDEHSGAKLTLVDCEGVQSPPLQLPIGTCAAALLGALENALAPSLRLDPPLWIGETKEKILPKLRKRSTATTATIFMDYVFRIVRNGNIHAVPEPLSPQANGHHDKCVSLPASPYISDTVDNLVNTQLDRACQSVRHQILARAFYGWLSYCRHLRTIRKHLVNLVEAIDLDGDEESVQPVNEEFWKICRETKTDELEKEFLKRIYWRGIEGNNPKELRRQTWPYLLQLFSWKEDPEPKTSGFTDQYRQDVEEWRVLEAEVRKRDEEAFIAARMRKPSPPPRDSSVVSDVFEPDEKPEEKDESQVLLNLFATNLHRIDKDVERCDRNLFFFSNKENLESLRRVMCTYVRRNLEEGYIQGMCDILAPLLVVFEDEALALECFTIIMARLRDNFPQRCGMDWCLSSLRSLIQVVDPQIFSMLTSSSDCTHLYFSYRWFLLDFKRELSYDCTYRVWETIWASGRTITRHFALFFALALITNYHDVIVSNNMDFTDMIKFFNEMAERHDCPRILKAARSHVLALQTLVKEIR